MKIFVWGTGLAVNQAIEKYLKDICISAYIDNDKNKKEFNGKKVYSPDYLQTNDYDCIIVANHYTAKIYEQCIKLNIDINKVIFLFNNYIFDDINHNYDFIENIVGKNSADMLKQQFNYLKDNSHVVSNSCGDDDNEYLSLNQMNTSVDYYNNDYVRIKIFEMIINEIKDVPGQIAELGVFRGDFAQYLNYAFDNRKLYLFDSFDGFQADEASEEINKNNCSDSFINSYKLTNLDIVMDKMVHKENVIIKKGFFPESLNGLEEQFAFVSLDVDLEESTLEGLRYFYPRLSSGGYIFIHDYNNCNKFIYENINLDKCVHNAVSRYEKELGRKMCKVPICDNFGTLIITK